MYRYNLPATALVASAWRDDYNNGARFITLADGIRVHRDAVIVTADGDTVHAVRALLVAMDAIGHADVYQTLTDAVAVGVPVADAIADVYADAVNGFDIVENEDGSAHAVPAVPARRVTDTTRVVIRHADGTTTEAVQSVTDALAVIVAGQRRALELVESGELADYADDIDAETVAEAPRY